MHSTKYMNQGQLENVLQKTTGIQGWCSGSKNTLVEEMQKQGGRSSDSLSFHGIDLKEIPFAFTTIPTSVDISVCFIILDLARCWDYCKSGRNFL